MASNTAIPRKDRTTNFDQDKGNELMCLLKEYPIIMTKKTDHTSYQQKDVAWMSLVDKFNSDALIYRTVQQLQQQFAKTEGKEMSAGKNGRRQTGGRPLPPKPTESTEWLNSITGESMAGLPALVHDSDALVNHKNNRRRHCTPLETRKCIISYLNNKKDHRLLQKYAEEEHKQNMNAQKKMNKTKLEFMTEKHRLFIDQQKELHQIEIEHRNQIHELTITKLRLVIENLKK